MGGLARSVAVAATRVLPSRARAALTRVPGLVGLRSRLLEREGYTVVRVEAGPLAGARLEIERQGEWSYRAGTYEPETQELLARLPFDGKVTWDVGAHAGFVSLLLAQRAARVLAVEPVPESARRLRTNVSLNHARVEVVEAAVGRAPGTAAMAPAGRMSRVDGTGSIAVRMTTLDELARAKGFPDLVKIDVEGAELDVVAGATEVLARRPILVIEAHSETIAAELATRLRALGYAVEDGFRAAGQVRIVAT